MLTERERMARRECAKFIRLVIQETRRGEVNGPAAMADARQWFRGELTSKEFEKIKNREIAKATPKGNN